MKRTIAVAAGMLLVAWSLQAQTFPYFQVAVVGQGEPVVLIPGFACAGSVWDETVAVLAANYTCHVVTLAGFGGVKPAPEPSLDSVRVALGAYVRQLDRPLLIGHSLGGGLVLMLAADAPAAVRGVLVVDALPFLAGVQDPTLTPDRIPMDRVQMGAQMAATGTDAFAAQQRQTLQTMITAPDQVEKALAWSLASDRVTMGRMFVDFYKTDLRARIAAIKVPVRVLGSGAFGAGYVTQAYALQYQALEGVQIEVHPTARHFIMYDAPDWWMAQVTGFVRERLNP
ncbi:MAG: alpha/beta hydrolase [Bacteroidia bacterium]|nr:alpha/beta hydrolase [Bacteroidia bacterium]